MVNHPPPPNIPGLRAEGELLNTLRSEVAHILARDSVKFPGAQPVSFAARHLQELQERDYFVCEKSDGIRCLMYLTNDGDREITYLIDRKNDYYWVKDLHFPLLESEQNFHTGAIVDGELVNDREPSGGIQMRYLVFDCLAINNSSLLHRTLDKRLAYYKEKIFAPYNSLYQKYPEEKQYLPFHVVFKTQERAYGIEGLFREILPKLPHGNDGLIFTCRTTPYKPGTDQHILKWKPADENSVDFRLHLDIPLCELDSEDEEDGIKDPYPDYSVTPTFNLSVGGDKGNDIPYGTMFVTPAEWDQLRSYNQPLDESIVECYQDESHRWRFMRFREDKKDANHISTVESVIQSIRDRIGERDLIGMGGKIRRAWKNREANDAAEAASGRKGSVPPNALPANGVGGRDLGSGVPKRKANESLDEYANSEATPNKKRHTP